MLRAVVGRACRVPIHRHATGRVQRPFPRRHCDDRSSRRQDDARGIGRFHCRRATQLLSCMGSRSPGERHRLSRAAGTPATMSAKATLLLDLDGTLTDNFAGISRSILHALAKLGACVVSDVELRHCVGPPLRHSFARLLNTEDPILIERALALYRERYAVEGWRENAVYAGIDAALAALDARGHRLLLCTSKPQVYAERIVAHFGLARHL